MFPPFLREYDFEPVEQLKSNCDDQFNGSCFHRPPCGSDGDIIGWVVAKSPSIGLDEFNLVYNHLETASVFAIVGFPLCLLKIPDNTYTGTRMEIFFSDLGVVVETDTFDPAGFFASRFECKRV